MTEAVENTGERILLEKETPLMIARHFCAYRFSRQYVGNKKILDIGCGEGYGTRYLAESAAEAVGIDYDQPVIDYARGRYIRDNLRFRVFDIRDLRRLEDKFDVICCFQVIEHIREPDVFLSNINALLAQGGIFLCSTPNKLDASPHSDTPHNKFHVREYLYPEFRRLLEGHFAVDNMLGLKRGKRLNFFRRLKKIGLFNFLPAALDPVKRFYGRIHCGEFIFTGGGLDKALDFIAVCKKYQAVSL